MPRGLLARLAIVVTIEGSTIPWLSPNWSGSSGTRGIAVSVVDALRSWLWIVRRLRHRTRGRRWCFDTVFVRPARCLLVVRDEINGRRSNGSEESHPAVATLDETRLADRGAGWAAWAPPGHRMHIAPPMKAAPHVGHLFVSCVTSSPSTLGQRLQGQHELLKATRELLHVSTVMPQNARVRSCGSFVGKLKPYLSSMLAG